MNKLREKYVKKYIRFLKENDIRWKSQSEMAITWNYHCFSLPCSYALPFNNRKGLKEKYINFIINDLTDDFDLLLSVFFSQVDFEKFKPYRNVKFDNSKDYIRYSIMKNKVDFFCDKLEQYIKHIVNPNINQNIYDYLIEKFY